VEDSIDSEKSLLLLGLALDGTRLSLGQVLGSERAFIGIVSRWDSSVDGGGWGQVRPE